MPARPALQPVSPRHLRQSDSAAPTAEEPARLLAPPAAASSAPPASRTPSFVCEVPLRVSPQHERVLLARLEAARAVYNACLGETLRRYRLVRESRAYQHARHLPRHTPERTEAFRAARAAYAWTDAALQAYAKDCRHDSRWIELHLDAPVTQKLASRAFHAVQRLAFGKAKRVRFKGKHQLDTVEGKSNETGLVWRSDRLVWRGVTLLARLPKSVEHRDSVLAHGLACRVKYVRLVRRKIGGDNRFCAQLICEGMPYQKHEHTLGQGIVGMDLGPSTIAVTTPSDAHLQRFCAELAQSEHAVRRQERHLARQRRANNPGNYLPNGRVKRGTKGRKHWRVSHRERKTQAHLADRQRRLKANRKSLHGKLAHTLIRQGNTFLLEKVSYSSWQRRFGRSVQRHAPGTFVSILTRLAVSAGGMIVNVPTRSTKLSQTCQCGQVRKKPLSLRVHQCEGCGVEMQRDLYSAYLIRFVDPKTYLLHADQAQAAWPGWEPILRAAWQQAHSTIQPASGGGRRPSSVRRRKAARASEPVARDRGASPIQESGCVAFRP
ncbi:MAG: RNA-guided endonuclease TnpB family protein [Ktedonobacterales bacterium]